MTMLLIDGDILLYQAASVAQQEVEFEEDVFTLFCNLSDAKDAAVTKLLNIIEEAKQQEDISSFHLCLSDRKNFRKDVYPLYKATRSARKPLGYNALREWATGQYSCVSKPGIEADDCIGILATKPGNNTLIWSIDKDLKQIPGKHLVDGMVVTVDLAEADRQFYTQTLTGDVVDNYPGCKGIGPVKAARLIEAGEKSQAGVWEFIRQAYVDAGFDEAFALTQARIARICRWEDWDQKEQKVKLWTPSSI